MLTLDDELDPDGELFIEIGEAYEQFPSTHWLTISELIKIAEIFGFRLIPDE